MQGTREGLQTGRAPVWPGKPWLPATQPGIPPVRKATLCPGPALTRPPATLPAIPLAA